MILRAIEKSLKQIIFNPIILLPAFILSVLVLLLEGFVGQVLEFVFSDIFLFGEELLSENIIFLMITNYYFELIAIILMSFLMMVFTILIWSIYSRISDSKGFIESINESILDIKKVITTSFVLYIISFVFFIGLILFTFILALISDFFPQIISSFLNIIIIPLIIFGMVLFFLVKIIFAFSTITKFKGKEIIQKSFEFSNNKMLSTTTIVFISFFAYFLISITFNYLGVIFLEFELIFEILGQTIGFSFLALTISYFYFLQ